MSMACLLVIRQALKKDQVDGTLMEGCQKQETANASCSCQTGFKYYCGWKIASEKLRGNVSIYVVSSKVLLETAQAQQTGHLVHILD